MASMLLMYLIVTIFPTLYFVHTVNPVHGTAGHLMAGKLLIWDTTVCWTAATECYCSISLNRTKELETNLREDLTITEKAPKYTNGAFSWHWKLCNGLLQALPCSAISISGVFTDFFALVASKSALEWRTCLHPDLDRSQGSLTGLKCLWRGSKGSVTVSVQVDIRPAE